MKNKAPLAREDDDSIAEELEAATDETPTDVAAPEVSEQTKELTEWDDVPSAHGTAAPKIAPDDEDDTIASQLVYEGTEEADRERRIAAADPDFEP